MIAQSGDNDARTDIIKHMQPGKRWLVSYKLLFGTLGLSAILTEMTTLAGWGKLHPLNFFSFFTVENNLLVSLLLILSAWFTARGTTGRWLDRLRGAATVYIIMVGIGFAVLLSGIEGVALTAVTWDNTVLHYIMPVAVFVDIILDRPKTRLRFIPSLLWLIYPALYLAYSLIRGAITDWYPYPFLNPKHNGYLRIAILSFGLLMLATFLIGIVCKLTTRCHSSSHENSL